MPRASRLPTMAETVRLHHDTIAGLIGQGAAEVEINAALTAAEGAGLDRDAMRLAVREGRLAGSERRAEVAAALDKYRLLMDPTPPLPGLASPEPTSQPTGRRRPRGGQLG